MPLEHSNIMNSNNSLVYMQGRYYEFSHSWNIFSKIRYGREFFFKGEQLVWERQELTFVFRAGRIVFITYCFPPIPSPLVTNENFCHLHYRNMKSSRFYSLNIILIYRKITITLAHSLLRVKYSFGQKSQRQLNHKVTSIWNHSVDIITHLNHISFVQRWCIGAAQEMHHTVLPLWSASMSHGLFSVPLNLAQGKMSKLWVFGLSLYWFKTFH